MSKRTLPLLLLALTVASACDRDARNVLVPSPDIRLLAPDLSYTIPADERAKILPTFDQDALQRLLQHLRPDARLVILTGFQQRVPGGPKGFLTALNDPVLQDLLEEVWVPYWNNIPTDQIAAEPAPIPGKHIALARRARTQGRDKDVKP